MKKIKASLTTEPWRQCFESSLAACLKFLSPRVIMDSKNFRKELSIPGRSSLNNEKDRHYFLNRFVCVGEFSLAD